MNELRCKAPSNEAAELKRAGEEQKQAAPQNTEPPRHFCCLLGPRKKEQVLHLEILPKANFPFIRALKGLSFQLGIQGIQKAYTIPSIIPSIAPY